MREIIYVAPILLALSLPALAADVPAPNSIVIIACRVDDLTGQPGRHDPSLAARDWRDLELHVNGSQEYECKRELLANLEDATAYAPNAPRDLIPLNPNFGNWTQCARVGVVMAQAWNEKNPGWGVVAVGCPTRIVNETGATVGWKMPSCPTYLPGTNNRMRCVFDQSVI